METIIDIIDKQIAWHAKYHKTANIDELLDFQDRLSNNSYNLAEIAASTRNNFNKSYDERKFKYAREFINMRSAENGTKKTIRDAEMESLENVWQEMVKERQNEYKADLINLKMRAIDKILISVSMRIKWLQNEYHLTKK